MMIKKVACLCLLAITVRFACINDCFASPVDSGSDLRISVGAPIAFQVFKNRVYNPYWYSQFNHDNTYLMTGINATISIGYRWQYIGVYIDQELQYADMIHTDDGGTGDSGFIGGTYLMFRGIIPINQKIQLDVGMGPGIMYSPVIIYKSYMHEAYGTKHAPHYVFGAKSSVAFLYYFSDVFALGFSIDYSFGILQNYQYQEFDEPNSSYYKVEQGRMFHNLNPGLLFVFRP